MDYEIIASGSSGNCVIIEDVMIDCGVGFRQIKDRLYDVKYLLLTHIHSDHVKPNTLKQIKRLFPHITVIGNYEIHYKYDVDIISNSGFPIGTDDYMFIPFDCVHDVVCQGFTWNKDDNIIIYATDTNSLQHAPDDKFDWFFIESNHDTDKLEQIKSKSHGYDAYAGALRHLSKQEARRFYFVNRRSKDAEFIELHKSGRFY